MVTTRLTVRKYFCDARVRFPRTLFGDVSFTRYRAHKFQSYVRDIRYIPILAWEILACFEAFKHLKLQSITIYQNHVLPTTTWFGLIVTCPAKQERLLHSYLFYYSVPWSSLNTRQVWTCPDERQPTSSFCQEVHSWEKKRVARGAVWEVGRWYWWRVIGMVIRSWLNKNNGQSKLQKRDRERENEGESEGGVS